MTNYWAPSLFNFWAQAKTVSQTVLLSIIPSAWNYYVSGTFITAEKFQIEAWITLDLLDLYNRTFFLCSPRLVFWPIFFTLESLYLYQTMFGQTIDFLADFFEEGPVVGDRD